MTWVFYRLSTGHIEAALTDAFAAVDAAFLEEAELQGLNDGTTAVTAVILPQQVLIGHVGDAKALLCQQPTRSSGAYATDAPGRISGHAHMHGLQQEHHPASGVDSSAGTVGHHRLGQVVDHVLQAHVLTKDHWPGRPDEQARLLAAGARVTAASTGSI